MIDATTRAEALAELIAKVEAGEWPNDWRDVTRVLTLHPDNRHILSKQAYNGSLDAALALHHAVLPGWAYRIGYCSVSDDAAVFPDFNCPDHGERLRATLDEGRDWFGDMDVDQRPPGNPARAWLLSILRALAAQEQA